MEFSSDPPNISLLQISPNLKWTRTLNHPLKCTPPRFPKIAFMVSVYFSPGFMCIYFQRPDLHSFLEYYLPLGWLGFSLIHNGLETCLPEPSLKSDRWEVLKAQFPCLKWGQNCTASTHTAAFPVGSDWSYPQRNLACKLTHAWFLPFPLLLLSLPYWFHLETIP